MSFNLRFLTLLCPSGANEINIECPAITPTYGGELLSNGDFANWTGDDPDDWTVQNEDANNYVTEAAGKARLVSNNTATVNFRQSVVTNGSVSVNDWLLLQWVQTIASGYVRTQVSGMIVATRNVSGDGTAYRTGYCTGNITPIFSKAVAGNTDYTVDDASLKVMDFSSGHVLLGDLGKKDGAYTCHPTAIAGTMCGILLEYADEDNLVLAVVDRDASAARILKCIGGTWSSVILGAIAYGAETELKVVVSGTDHSLYYNDVQVGATTAIADAGLGTAVHGFNTLTGNTVGQVTVV